MKNPLSKKASLILLAVAICVVLLMVANKMGLIGSTPNTQSATQQVEQINTGTTQGNYPARTKVS